MLHPNLAIVQTQRTAPVWSIIFVSVMHWRVPTFSRELVRVFSPKPPGIRSNSVKIDVDRKSLFFETIVQKTWPNSWPGKE